MLGKAEGEVRRQLEKWIVEGAFAAFVERC